MEEARVHGFMLGTFEDGGEQFPGRRLRGHRR